MYSCAVNPLLPRSPPRAIGAVHALASASGLTQRGAVTAIDPKMDSKMINARWDLHDVLRIRRRQIEKRSEERRVGKECRSRWTADHGTRKNIIRGTKRKKST